MGGSEVVDRVTATVTYLRVTVGAGSEAAGWWSCQALLSDPHALVGLARMTAAGRGTDRDQVAVSLLVQGYAFRIASIAIGAWLLGDAILDVAPAHTALAIGRHRPDAVRLDSARLISFGDSPEALHAELIDGHLAPLVAAAHVACRVGEALLWANVGAACASSFRAFVEPLSDRRDEIFRRAETFFSTARPALAASGRLVAIGTEWAWERGACCLWYQTSGGSRCEDCSLWSDGERRNRYDSVLARQQGDPEAEAESP
ncbi:MAG: IucA/IucC family C-terminal-domain containing protein [Acidimicrobiales bacterium]